LVARTAALCSGLIAGVCEFRMMRASGMRDVSVVERKYRQDSAPRNEIY
jgi:hypothetical protein